MTADERATVVHLPGGPLPYTLRHSTRARSLRVVIHPERGVIVTVPATRAARADGERRAAEFLGQREAWVRRHLARQADTAAALAARGGARDGGCVPFRGELHAVRVVPAVSGLTRSRRRPPARDPRAHRPPGRARPAVRTPRSSRRWLRVEARDDLDAAIARHAEPLGVEPTRRHAARSADALGERVPDRSVVVLVAAGPGPARGPRVGRRPRARPPARVRARPALLGARRDPPCPTTGPGGAGCTTTPSSSTGRSASSAARPPGREVDDGRPVPAQRVRVERVGRAVGEGELAAPRRRPATSALGRATSVLRTGARSTLRRRRRGVGRSRSGARISDEPQPEAWMAVMASPSMWAGRPGAARRGPASPGCRARSPGGSPRTTPQRSTSDAVDVAEGRPDVDAEAGPDARRDRQDQRPRPSARTACRSRLRTGRIVGATRSHGASGSTSQSEAMAASIPDRTSVPVPVAWRAERASIRLLDASSDASRSSCPDRGERPLIRRSPAPRPDRCTELQPRLHARSARPPRPPGARRRPASAGRARAAGCRGTARARRR